MKRTLGLVGIVFLALGAGVVGGRVVVLPVIAAYTIGVYWVFRGKIDRLGT